MSFRIRIIQYFTMTPDKQKTKRIGKHDFRITGRPKVHFSGKCIVSFAPLPPNKEKTNTKILPTFNNDRKYYTDTFVIPSDPPINDEYMRKSFQQIVLRAQVQIQSSEILIPKPKSQLKLCQVCMVSYEDYKEHYESVVHLSCLKKSNYQALINHTCKDFQRRMAKKQLKKEKTSEPSTEKPHIKLKQGTSLSNPILLN